MSTDDKPVAKFLGQYCQKCGKTHLGHEYVEAIDEWFCKIPQELPPPPKKTKMVAYDLWARCEGCSVNKYINRVSRLCFACS